ncbi:hypothetical protein ACFLUY_01230 [Chloroflexota bacterium]
MKVGVKSKKTATASLGLREIITWYQISNQADGKSPRTIDWYTEMLMSFLRYMKTELQCNDISAFNIDNIRSYIIHLQNRPKFQGHPFTPNKTNCFHPEQSNATSEPSRHSHPGYMLRNTPRTTDFKI